MELQSMLLSHFPATNRILIAALSLAALIGAPQGLFAQDRILKEWAVPSPPNAVNVGDASLLAGDDVYFTEFVGGNVGKLSTRSNRLTEWLVSQLGSQILPGRLLRVGDRIFFTEALPSSSQAPLGPVIGLSQPTTAGAIGALDPETGEVNQWTTPGGPPASLVRKGRHVYFLEPLSNRIGSLNPGTGEIREWELPTAAPGSTGSGCISFSGSLEDFFEGVPTSCITFSQAASSGFPSNIALLVGLDVDRVGNNLWFTEDVTHRIARLNVFTNTLTEWPLPAATAGPYQVHLQEHIVYFTAGDSVMRLDPTSNIISVWTDPNGTSCPPPSPLGPPCLPTILGDLSARETGERSDEADDPSKVFFTAPGFSISTPAGQSASNPQIGVFVTAAAAHTDYVVAPVSTNLTTMDSNSVVTNWTASQQVTDVTPSVTEIESARDGDFTFWTLPTNPGLLSMSSRGSLVFTEQMTNKIALFGRVERIRHDDDDQEIDY